MAIEDECACGIWTGGEDLTSSPQSPTRLGADGFRQHSGRPRLLTAGVHLYNLLACCNGEFSFHSLSSLPKWRNWQTRVVQVHVLARVWGFESLLRHQDS